MTDLITIDYETFYTKDYDLKSLSTEDYVADPRFEVILVSAKRNDEPAIWTTGSHKHVRDWLAQWDIENNALLAHNARFDALITQLRFGMRPKFILDTAQMAQAFVKPYSGSVSLKACLEFFDIGVKGTVVHDMKGRPRQSLSKQEMQTYADYCVDDTNNCYKLFRTMAPLFPHSELRIADMTHRMYLDPVIELDVPLLHKVWAEGRAEKQRLLNTVAHIATQKDLRSGPKFAKVLQSIGVDPPQKVSPTTGKLTWAFSKNDAEFKQFCEAWEDNELVTTLIEARLGNNSSIEETRAKRLAEIGEKYGVLRVPLNYYSAHTGRYGGTEKINMQNPPRVDKSRLRYTLVAPKGMVFLAADLAQIEARITAWLAGQLDLLLAFERGEDVYSAFATQLFGRTITKADKIERFIGKTCILGLGFGMGYKKLRATLAKDGIKLSDEVAQKYVEIYRSIYARIPELWRTLDAMIPTLRPGSKDTLRIHPITFASGLVKLPNEMFLHYPHVKMEASEAQWRYRYGKESRTLWGGKLCENIVQSLARIVVMEQMLRINDELGLRPVMQVHDELDYIVPESDAPEIADKIKQIMSTPPVWATTLPTAVEVVWGKTFGDCK